MADECRQESDTRAARVIYTLTPPQIHEHDALRDLDASLAFIQRGVSALKGIGEMMRPAGLEQTMNASIDSASSVFEFFGEVLDETLDDAVFATEKIRRYVKEREQA